jgi:hypothetical protein
MPQGWRRLTLDDFFWPITLTEETYEPNIYYIKDSNGSFVLSSRNLFVNNVYYINQAETFKFKN